MMKVGCKYLKPRSGAREQLVTNFRSMQRSLGSKPFITCGRIPGEILNKQLKTSAYAII